MTKMKILSNFLNRTLNSNFTRRLESIDFFRVLIIILAAIFASKAFFFPHYLKTHEPGNFAILSQLDKNVEQGYYRSIWFPDYAGGGEPVFLFYAPFAFYVAEIFHLFSFSIVTSIKLTFVTSYILSGISMYIYASYFLKNKNAGLIAAVAYLFVPYHLVDSNVRGDLPETFAFVWIPLVFYFIHKGVSEGNPVKYGTISGIFLGFLVLTHNPSALINTYLILFYFLFLVFIKNKKTVITIGLLTIIVGLGCSSFFWIPAIKEMESVHMDLIVRQYPLHNNYVAPSILISRPNWDIEVSGPGRENGMPLTLGLLYLVMVFYSMVCIKRKDKHVSFFLLVFFIFAFLTTLYGLRILKVLPYMEYLQFPWRLMIVTSFTSSILFGYSAKHMLTEFKRFRIKSFKIKSKKPIIFTLLALIVLVNYKYTAAAGGFYEPDPNDPNQMRRKEYIPVGCTQVSLQTPDIQLNNNHASYTLLVKKGNYWNLNINTNVNTVVKFKVFNFTGWNGYIDSQRVSITSDSNGLIIINVPPGEHTVELKFEDTPLRSKSKLITIVTIFFVIVLLIYSRKIYENKENKWRV